VPAASPVMLEVVCPPGPQTKVIGALPPVRLTVADPSLPPKQLTSVLSNDILKLGAAMTILSVIEQVPVTSVTVTE